MGIAGDIEKHIFDLENALLTEEVRKSEDKLNQLISDNFVEFGKSGKIYKKSDILKFLPKEEFKKITITDFEIISSEKDEISVRYKSNSEDNITLRSSIWKKGGDNWKIIFHQGTKIENKPTFDSSKLSGKEIVSDLLKSIKQKQKIDKKILIRPSEISDIDDMILLSKAKRLNYEKAQPQFWRYAGKQGDNAQRKWFKELLESKEYLLLTAQNHNKEMIAFVIGKLITAPEVYDPKGLTLMIDDFCVKSENLWEYVGEKLIKEIKDHAKMKGATQIVVVCGDHDKLKCKFLKKQNLSIASNWFVGEIS